MINNAAFKSDVKQPVISSVSISSGLLTTTVVATTNSPIISNGFEKLICNTTTPSMEGSELDSSSVLPPLKAPKSYGTYSRQQQEDVIAFIKDGNSLRTAEKIFGIPKSTMHCWLKKQKLDNDSPAPADIMEMDMIEEKLSPELKKRNNCHFSQENPKTQIVVEETELIRFLQTTEGAELIAKAYDISVNDFYSCIKQAKKGRLKESPNHLTTPHAPSNRKRSCDFNNIFHYVTNLENPEKRQKLENNSYSYKTAGESDLISLLTNNAEKKISNRPSKEQLVVARSCIEKPLSGAVKSYVAKKPFAMTDDLTTQTTPRLRSDKAIKEPTYGDELSPTYPKVVSPVYIKTERNELNYTTPSSSSPYFTQTLEPKLQLSESESHFINTLPSSHSAALNLNEINRSQSEKELMALVDCENSVSADELCADFGKGLDVTNWIDNEAWYMDQYCQHFGVSPTSNLTGSSSVSSDYVLPSVSSVEDDSVITFTLGNDREKILCYVDEGHTLEEAGRVFNVKPDRIHQWIEQKKDGYSDEDTKSKFLVQSQKEHHEPTIHRENAPHAKSYSKSAFSRAASSRSGKR